MFRQPILQKGKAILGEMKALVHRHTAKNGSGGIWILAVRGAGLPVKELRMCKWGGVWGVVFFEG